jgi:hypothetical protein
VMKPVCRHMRGSEHTFKWSSPTSTQMGEFESKLGEAAGDERVFKRVGEQESIGEQARHAHQGCDQCASSSVPRSCVVSCRLRTRISTFESIVIMRSSNLLAVTESREVIKATGLDPRHSWKRLGGTAAGDHGVRHGSTLRQSTEHARVTVGK